MWHFYLPLAFPWSPGLPVGCSPWSPPQTSKMGGSDSTTSKFQYPDVIPGLWCRGRLSPLSGIAFSFGWRPYSFWRHRLYIIFYGVNWNASMRFMFIFVCICIPVCICKWRPFCCDCQGLFKINGDTRPPKNICTSFGTFPVGGT